jgi:hypothetical protein
METAPHMFKQKIDTQIIPQAAANYNETGKFSPSDLAGSAAP